MKKIGLLIAILSIVLSGSAMAMQDMPGMEHGSDMKDGNFVHSEMVGGMHAEFQIMDLASMNMKDPDGKTHHVMATFMHDNQKVMKAVGKIKLVSPSGKEQIAPLKDYGSGIFAANFTIDEPGKWGVICLFKTTGEPQTVKFWYSHMNM